MQYIFTLVLLTYSLFSNAQQPIELGKVQWLRDYTVAQQKAKSENKPILILFQEVPGCSTCQQYGQTTLSHPLIVETIETYFIPLAIYNNKQGHDAEILKRYNEPSWNNPVVRMVDENGNDLLPRLSGNYSPQGLISNAIKVIGTRKGKVPEWLQLLATELESNSSNTTTATYSMYCFWTGEALFGKLNGVVKTTAAFQSGKEIVNIIYNPAILSKTELDKIASQNKCSAMSNGNHTPDKTPKYYLSNSSYRSVPMLEIQKCRVNSALAEKQLPEEFLSPRQLAIYSKHAGVNAVSLSIEQAWYASKPRL